MPRLVAAFRASSRLAKVWTCLTFCFLSHDQENCNSASYFDVIISRIFFFRKTAGKPKTGENSPPPPPPPPSPYKTDLNAAGMTETKNFAGITEKNAGSRDI